MLNPAVRQALIPVGGIIAALGFGAAGYLMGAHHKTERYQAALCSTHGGTLVAGQCLDSTMVKHPSPALRTFDCPPTGSCIEHPTPTTKTEGR